MPIYDYKAFNLLKKRVKGQLIAFDEDDVRHRLKANGLELISTSSFSDSLSGKLTMFLNRVKNKDLVIFSRQFSLMVSSDIRIVEALMITADQTDNLRLKSVLAEAAFEVNAGSQLSEALAAFGNIFSGFYINLLKAGESSGQLSETLDYLADEMEKDYDMTSKFKGAMIYPAIVISGLVGVGFVMMFFVMPQLTDIMQETGAKLPLATRIVIGISDFLGAYAWMIGVFLVVSLVAARSFYKTAVGRRQFDKFLIHMPLFGKLFSYTYLIRFCRSFGTMLKGGVTITRGLEVSADVVRNTVYKDLINETLEAVTDGASVASVFSRSTEIPKMLPQMMSVGEKVGHLDIVLDKVADFYSRELKAKLDNINTIMEPVIMIVMGVGVGIMVAAVIMPMYNVATSF